MKRSERYRALADLLAYLEQQNLDEDFTVIDDAEGFEITESLHEQLAASTEASTLLEAATKAGITIYRYNSQGYVSDDDDFFVVA